MNETLNALIHIFLFSIALLLWFDWFAEEWWDILKRMFSFSELENEPRLSEVSHFFFMSFFPFSLNYLYICLKVFFK